MSGSHTNQIASVRILLTSGVLALAGSASAQTISGAVAHWPFDDGLNPTVDVVGGYDGTIVGATFDPSDSAPMPGCGQSLKFTGTDYVSVANTAALNVPPGTAMSIALWFKETGFQSTFHILGKRTGCDANSAGINYQFACDPVSGLSFNSENGGIVATNVPAQLDVWTHLAVTYDGIHDLTVYVDGTPMASSTTYKLGGSNGNDLLIGGSGTCGGNIIGKIDEVWFFNRAITASEVHLLASQNPGTYCSAKVNSLGCMPTMGSSGSPTLSGPDNFNVIATNVLNNKFGLMFWGGAPANAPFFGGTRCVAAPIVRTQTQVSGGNPPPNDCSGQYSFHFSHAYMAAHALAAGSTVYAQYWSRDPGFAPPNNIGLTDGLQFVICP